MRELIEKNTSSSTVTSGTVVLPTSLLNMDPQSGAAVTVWTAPSSGLFTITGSFQGDDNAESSHPVEILEDGGTVLLGPTTISSFGQVVNFSFTLNLSAGDTLDFIVSTDRHRPIHRQVSMPQSSDGCAKPLILDVGTTANPVPAGATVQLYRTPVDPAASGHGHGGAGQHADEHGWRGREDRRHQPEQPGALGDARSGDPGRDVRLHGRPDRPGGERQPAQSGEPGDHDRHRHPGGTSADPGAQLRQWPAGRAAGLGRHYQYRAVHLPGDRRAERGGHPDGGRGHEPEGGGDHDRRTRRGTTRSPPRCRWWRG